MPHNTTLQPTVGWRHLPVVRASASHPAHYGCPRRLNFPVIPLVEDFKLCEDLSAGQLSFSFFLQSAVPRVPLPTQLAVESILMLTVSCTVSVSSMSFRLWQRLWSGPTPSLP
jgi:hypothetical protein